jgi:hypothetical protein
MGNLNSQGLYKKVIKESDLKKYENILKLANAHLEELKPGANINIIRGLKFRDVISILFPQTIRSVHWVTY